MPSSPDHAQVIALPPVIFLLTTLVSVALRFVLSEPMLSPALAYSGGLAIALVSGSLALWARQEMLAVGTNIIPNQPTLALAMAGPYRFTRNPMYLSLCLLEIAVGLFCNRWLSLACVVPLALILHFGVVRREEVYLENKFGEPYRSFRRRVRRWL